MDVYRVTGWPHFSVQVIFNGSMAYCPQSAWIMNATLRCGYTYTRVRIMHSLYTRDNVLFGSELDEAR